MEIPDTLPARLYLLAYDARRGRLTARSRLAYLIRAAALVDLQLRGHLADEKGRPRAVTTVVSVLDPVLESVLAEVMAGKSRRWQRWVASNSRQTLRAVRDQLATEKWIRVETRRLLGLIPVTTVTVRDPRILTHLDTLVRAALGPARPSSQVQPRDAALVALAAAAELPTALTRRQRREHRTRIAELADQTGPAVRALSQAYAADAAAV
ncbi:MAG: GOLPH3/VPS74 family protein [Pseudonocardiales bacterium]